MFQRHFSLADRLIQQFDQAVRTVAGKPLTSDRPNPAKGLAEAELPEADRQHTAALMRINHTGEVCAQALYQGQALTAKLSEVRQNMELAAIEENDHLEWCETRSKELGGRTSYLNPLWYAGSFAIGATAGLIGDKWSLGFVAETEKQVVKHLDEHLLQIRPEDAKTRAILEQMKTDEQHHANTALAGGGATLPLPVRLAMQLTAKLMTITTYRI